MRAVALRAKLTQAGFLAAKMPRHVDSRVVPHGVVYESPRVIMG
jgi:hypothetical protein